MAGNEGPPQTNFERVVKFFMANGNHPSTARKIVAGAGVSRSALSQILYKTHKDAFVSGSVPGFNRKKWFALNEETVDQLEVAGSQLQEDLFGEPIGDLSRETQEGCCIRILKEHGNKPMPALTIAREALRRGYHGSVKGSEDEVLQTTAKSFWALMGRKENKYRFVQVRPLVFRLRVPEDGPALFPTGTDQGDT